MIRTISQGQPSQAAGSASRYTQPAQKQSPVATPQWAWNAGRGKKYWVNTTTREFVYEDGTTLRY